LFIVSSYLDVDTKHLRYERLVQNLAKEGKYEEILTLED
jgi:hypothetical protein